MSGEYHKIQTLWKRESEKPCNMIVGEYSTPELAALASVPIWTLTEKVDGTNIRVMYAPGRGGEIDHDADLYAIRGKTDRAQTPDFLREEIERLIPKEALATMFGGPTAGLVTLYGEGFGARIQKGGGNYIPDGCSFVLFDVLIDGLWLERKNVEDIATKLGIRSAPVVDDGVTLGDFAARVKSGVLSRWGDFMAEGLVARTVPELQDRRGHRIITKLKTADYLKLDNATRKKETDGVRA